MYYEILLLGQFEWNLLLFIFLLGIALIYSVLLKRFTTITIFKKQPLFFLLSLSLLYLLIGSPLSVISHLSFSLHMIQMSILYFIIPPLILLGIPEPMFQQIRKGSITKCISKLFVKPKHGLFLFSTLFLFYHLPFVLNPLSQNPMMQNGYLSLLFIFTFSMWWPIVSPDLKQRLHAEKKKRYIFLSGIVIMPACILFISNAIVGGIENPFLNQMTAELCLPPQMNSLPSLPFQLSTTFDQLMAGTLMLGIHKFSLFLFTFLDNSLKKG